VIERKGTTCDVCSPQYVIGGREGRTGVIIAALVGSALMVVELTIMRLERIGLVLEQLQSIFS
jgi:hypothetical protein